MTDVSTVLAEVIFRVRRKSVCQLMVLQYKLTVLVRTIHSMLGLFRYGKCLKPLPNDHNIVGHNMLHAFGHPVAMCCDMLGVVCSSLKIVKFETTTPNMSQHDGKTCATCCAQQCSSTLCWHVAIIWPGLYTCH